MRNPKAEVHEPWHGFAPVKIGRIFHIHMLCTTLRILRTTGRMLMLRDRHFPNSLDLVWFCSSAVLLTQVLLQRRGGREWQQRDYERGCHQRASHGPVTPATRRFAARIKPSGVASRDVEARLDELISSLWVLPRNNMAALPWGTCSIYPHSVSPSRVHPSLLLLPGHQLLSCLKPLHISYHGHIRS
jgi:hypothetical protein